MTQPTDAEKELALANWAEQCGTENLRSHIASIDGLKDDSAKTLTILMTALGALIAYGAKMVDDHHAGPMLYAVAALTTYLLVVSSLLVAKCLRVADAPPVTNEPQNLFQPAHTLLSLKIQEISNLEGRIRAAKKRNQKTARWLNGLRYAALASPLVFAVTYALADRCSLS